MKKLWTAAVALLALFTAGAHASCGSAFCTVNTGWDVHGGLASPGSTLDLRYEAITQDQPRNGSTKVGVGQIRRHHDEVSTKNRNLVGTYDTTFNADWGLSVSAPLVDRQHGHIHNHNGGRIPEAWDFRALGDVRAVARYRLASHESREHGETGASGLLFGVKLPTGRINLRNAAGDLAERTLQPGTGTTDAIVGAYTARALPMRDLSWFAQAQFQAAVNARDQYRPGRRLSVDGGLRYDLGDAWSLLLQANLLVRGRDAGRNAEPDDSGGTALFLSPGVAWSATRDLRVYAHLQLPLYQYVNGVQLTAARAAVVGVGARF